MKLKNSKLPLYHQLAEKITEGIKNNNLKEDEKIPSEREYCERYKVSRSTVREAVKHLSRQDIFTEFRVKEHMFHLK